LATVLVFRAVLAQNHSASAGRRFVLANTFAQNSELFAAIRAALVLKIKQYVIF
jgi:hypothetical protein